MEISDEHKGSEYFTRLFNGIADAVFISECLPDGTPGQYIEVNDVACDLLQYQRAELLAMSPLHINRIAIEDRKAFHEIIDEIKRTRKTLFKTELLSCDGRWVPVEIGSQLFELDGKTVYFSVARDITIRQKYEESIQTLVRSTVGLTGQQCLNEIVKNLCSWLKMDGACIGIVHGKEIEIRARFIDGSLVAPTRIPVEGSPFTQVLNGEFSIYLDNADLIQSDYFEPLGKVSGYIGTPMMAHDGKVMGFVSSFSREPLQSVPHVEELLSVIASRAAAECERMHFVRELSRSEERFRTIFNSTAEAIVGIDMSGKIVFCNPSAIKILGYDNENDLIGVYFHQLINASSQDQNVYLCHECPFIDAISKSHKISSEDDFFTHKDGHQVPVEYWGHPMLRDNKLVGGVITFIDISRRKTLEKQLQHSQRMEAIGTLTGGIAHDFNNILTVISGYVGLLQSQITDNPKLLSKIMKIGEAAERGSKLTHGLLAYSRKKSEPSTPLDLNHLILKTQDFLERVIGERFDKKLEICSDSLVVMADHSQLEQVLINLVTNARDAMIHGGLLTIKTEPTEIDGSFCQMYGYGEPGPYALMTVSDTGTGIPKEIHQKIFDPFFTTKDTGKGTGLGLAMAWGIVKQHKGYISVDSAPDQGSTFKIYLPLTNSCIESVAAVENTVLPGGDETLLLVEDDPLVRESTHSILTSVGYSVIISNCAESALKILGKRHQEFSMILSDVVMPGIKGPEFYQEIRKITSAPVVFMSGYTFDSLHEQGLVKEGVRLLNKPIQAMKLLTCVRETINSAH